MNTNAFAEELTLTSLFAWLVKLPGVSVNPVNVVGASFPGAPLSPFIASPLSPFIASPLSPLSPSLPVCPISPLSPLSPGSPFAPGSGILLQA